jgi:hypothetical protein
MEDLIKLNGKKRRVGSLLSLTPHKIDMPNALPVSANSAHCFRGKEAKTDG